MKILYDSTIFSVQRYGGVSRYFFEIIKRISKYKDISVNTFKGLSILPHRFSKLNNVFLNCKLLKYKYDIYHPTYYSNSIIRRKHVKTVVTVYDMIHELFLPKFKELAEGIDIKKRSILNADHIICISNTTKNDLKKIYGINDDRISVVYLGVSSDGIDSGYAKFNKPVRPYILYVGRRQGYKNFGLLLDAFSRLKIENDFDLLCFGGGPFSGAESARFKELGIEKSVKHEQGTDDLLNFYYKNAFVFIMLSFYEGFGLPLLEAMANNCPVIASNAGSLPEIAQDAALLFSPENADELCSCINSMLKKHNLRSDCIKKGSLLVRNFSWDNTARETYQVYRKVLDAR